MSTDSRLSFEEGRLLTSIWNATVTNEPPPPEAWPDFKNDDGPSSGRPGFPSGETVKPDGSSGM